MESEVEIRLQGPRESLHLPTLQLRLGVLGNFDDAGFVHVVPFFSEDRQPVPRIISQVSPHPHEPTKYEQQLLATPGDGVKRVVDDEEWRVV